MRRMLTSAHCVAGPQCHLSADRSGGTIPVHRNMGVAVKKWHALASAVVAITLVTSAVPQAGATAGASAKDGRTGRDATTGKALSPPEWRSPTAPRLLPRSKRIVGTRVVVSGHDLPASNLLEWRSDCANHLVGPNNLPDWWYRKGGKLGTHAIGWAHPTGNDESGPLVPIAAPASLSRLTVHLNSANGGTTGHGIVLYYDTRPAYANGVWLGVTNPFTETGAGWEAQPWRFDLASFTWTFIPNGGGATTAGGTATIQNFANNASGNGNGAYVGMAAGCDGGTFYVDDLEVTTNAESYTIDFEGAPTAVGLVRWVPKRSTWQGGKNDSAAIKYGGNLFLGGFAIGWGLDPERDGVFTTSNDYSVFDGTGTLRKKVYGSKKWVKVKTGSYGPGDPGFIDLAVFDATPSRRTLYRFDSAGSPVFDTGPSYQMVVNVKARVTASVAQRRIRVGQFVTLRGNLAPKNKGTTVQLQRKIGAKWKTLSQGKTGKKGTFTLRARARAAGRWTVRVRALAGKGNLGDTTRNKYVSISKPKPKPDDLDPDAQAPAATPTPPVTQSPPIGDHRRSYLRWS